MPSNFKSEKEAPAPWGGGVEYVGAAAAFLGPGGWRLTDSLHPPPPNPPELHLWPQFSNWHRLL